MTGQHPRNMADWMRIQERSHVQMRSLAGLVNKAVARVRGDVEQITIRQPAAPVELQSQTNLYLNAAGNYRARFILDFPDVTKATDGSDITVRQYELWGRDVTENILALTTSAAPGAAAPGLTLPGLAATPSNLAMVEDDAKPWQLVTTSVESSFRAEDYLPGTTWEFKARALGQGMITEGVLSAVVTVQMAQSSTPPPQATAPTVTASRGTLTVSWDGQSVNGPMPADFKYAVLAHGTASSPTAEVHRFNRTGGIWVLANIDYYDPQFFRVRAVDEAGNLGPWSAQAVGYTTPLVDQDVILSTIDGAVTHLKNIDAGVSILPDTVITEHLLVTEDMTAKMAQFLHVQASMLEVNEIWADEAWFGVADAVLVRSDMFVGKEFFGGVFTLTDGGRFQTDVEDLTGIKWDTVGIKAWNSGAEQTFWLDAATGNVEIVGTFQVGRAADPYVLMTADAWGIWPGIRFKVQDPGLDYQPTIFAIGDTHPDWSVGDFVMLGGQDVANTSPRGNLVIGNRGEAIFLGREFVTAGRHGLQINADGSTTLMGWMRDSVVANETFIHGGTSATSAAAGTFSVIVTPPPQGIRRPIPIPDGLNPVTFATKSVATTGFDISFSGGAGNITSFRFMLYLSQS